MDLHITKSFWGTVLNYIQDYYNYDYEVEHIKKASITGAVIMLTFTDGCKCQVWLHDIVTD